MDEPSKALRNARHEAFCAAYCGECRGNAAASYLQAGFRCKDREVAKRMASRLLKRPDVAARVRHLEDELAEREKLKAIDAIRHLKAVATASLSDFYDKNGRVDPCKLSDPWLSQVIESVTPIYDRDGNFVDYKIKLKDSMKALELLGLTKPRQSDAQQLPVLVIKT